MGGRAVQTQMPLEVGHNMYPQILILPLCPNQAPADNARAHRWLWAPGCRPRNADCIAVCLLIPQSLTFPGSTTPVSGPGPQYQPSAPFGVFVQGLLCLANTH